MPKIQYQSFDFTQRTRNIIVQANEIIDAYHAQGYDLTLRQLYYQFVSRDLIKNNIKEYNRLGNIINDARLNGDIDWNAIVDRTRNLQSLSHWETPGGVIDSAAASYQIDRWKDQPNRVEVWIEKEALAGVFERACQKWDTAFFSCRGYTSQSEMWRAAMRLRSYERKGQDTTILHFGDHDPSGIDMTRDIQDRLALFGAQTTIQRVALNFDQIEQYNPPPNPAKMSDSRFQAYADQYGDESWELDALDPATLSGLVDREIRNIIDIDLYNAQLARLSKERAQLQEVADRWDDVPDALGISDISGDTESDNSEDDV
jgi:hypothetical protein